MKQELSALDQDIRWLNQNGYGKIDPEVFCSMVTRDWSDAHDNGNKYVLLDDIRMNVIEKMLRDK